MSLQDGKIGISFSVIAPDLSKQLKQQGFKYSATQVKTFEREIEALNQLRFGSCLLTDTLFDKLTTKLYKKIVSHVAKVNKLQVKK